MSHSNLVSQDYAVCCANPSLTTCLPVET